jgi:hypothetical protein
VNHIQAKAARRHAIAAAALAALAGPALSADWEISGQLRQEIAVKTTSDQNKNNQTGNPSNGNLDPANLTGGLAGPALARPGAFKDDANINSFATRLDVNVDGKMSESLKATIKLRARSEQVGSVDDAFDGDPKAATLSGQMFRQEFGGTAGGPLAYGGNRNSIDLPSAYLDYNNGPLWIRAGNQQIAWGEAIFFRVADVPNALDFRGHLFDPAAEEYSDKRRAALGLRVNYRVSEKLDVDAFAQRFAPTLLPNGETPYNFITDQFTIHTKEGYDKVKNNWNVGFRLRAELGDVGLQAFAVSRNNPDGVYKWSGATGAGALPFTSFEAGTGTGVYHAGEWFDSASRSRLNGIEGVDASLRYVYEQTPTVDAYGLSGLAAGCGAADSTYGQIRSGTREAAQCILNTFFSPAVAGNLRGHLSRTFPRETVVGFGLNKVFEGEPDSLLDQLIGRFEMSYTKDKKFTNPTLGNYLEEDEYQFAFIAEKYHKFVSSFPATYFVLQWLHKSESDLFGRHLSGVDSKAGERPKGDSNFNAVALALQQPSPTLLYRFDFAILTDLKGGWYAQPGLRWKPSKSIQGDLYANIVAGSKSNKTFTDGLQHNNEIFARLGILF